MNTEQALKTAIEYEKRVRDVYVEARDETTDPEGKRLFSLMADEEHGHVIYLEAKLSHWVTQQKISLDDFDSVRPPDEDIQQAVEKLQDKLLTEERQEELTLLNKALDVETETSQFYARMVAELEAPGKELFRRFLEIETGHLSLVQAEIEYRERKGEWLKVTNG